MGEDDPAGIFFPALTDATGRTVLGRHQRGRHFDPELVDAFLALPDEVLAPPRAEELDEITISPQDIRISTPSR